MHLDDLRRASLTDLARHIQGVTSKDAFRISEVCDVLLKKAVLARVSDVHIEPTLRGSRVRYRIDGVFQDAAYLPVELHEQLVSRVKVLADLLSHRREIVQEGRISLEAGEGRTDLRVSVVPTVGGEKVVARIFSTEASLFRLEQIGYDPAMQRRIRNIIFDLEGLFLLTGPSGSGKTTTLYALLNEVAQELDAYASIITIEDPVEFVHKNVKCLVNQREVGQHTKSFKNALRAALREDPDIVLVGEMRDLETIAIAIETAETGHLVFGTLHTTTAVSTVDRIIDQFPADRQAQVRVMLSESLKGVVAQVLCKKIGGGRVAAHEVLLGTHAVGALIREGKTFQMASVLQTSKAQGMMTMNDSLFNLVQKGLVEPKEAWIKAVDKSGLIGMFKNANLPTNFT